MSCDSGKATNLVPECFFDGLFLQLAYAIQDNQLDEVRRLDKEVELNKFHKENMTPLIWAMLTKQPEALEVLIKEGADPNLKDNANTQPVALAVTMGDDNPYLRILLRHGGNPNSFKQSEPALHVAYDFDYYKNVLLLLDAGADINERDRDGNTILISAAIRMSLIEPLTLSTEGRI